MRDWKEKYPEGTDEEWVENAKRSCEATIKGAEEAVKIIRKDTPYHTTLEKDGFSYTFPNFDKTTITWLPERKEDRDISYSHNAQVHEGVKTTGTNDYVIKDEWHDAHTCSFKGICPHSINGEWIAVKDKLPTKPDRYLCYDERQGLQMVVEWLYDFESRWWIFNTEVMHPTHWRYCPEAPKFEEK